ncbi:MAG: hypothetical protein AAFQ99_09730 [Pseudomonadota bacterium]
MRDSDVVARMKHRLFPALGVAMIATGCVVSPAPMLETGSVVQPAPVDAAPPSADPTISRQITHLQSEVARISADLQSIERAKAPAERPRDAVPVAQLKADVDRLNAVIAALQSEVAETRKHLDRTTENSRSDLTLRERNEKEIAALHTRIERTNTLLLEVARSLAGQAERANAQPITTGKID